MKLEKVPIFPRRIGSSLDELYGNLEQDIVAKLDSFTLNFSAMTLSLGLPLPDRPAHREPIHSIVRLGV